MYWPFRPGVVPTGSLLVVLTALGLHLRSGVSQAGEPVLVRAPAAQATVEDLDVAALIRLAGFDRSKRPVWLSITHILGAEQVTNFDIRQPGEASPDDSVTSWRVTRAIQVSAEASQLGQSGV